MLASNNLAIRYDDVPVFSMASDPAFMCNGPLLVLNPDKKIGAVTDDIDQSYTYLSQCAARVVSRLQEVFGTVPSTIIKAGCYYNSDGIVPYVVFDQTTTPAASCVDIQSTNQISAFSCVDTSIPSSTKIYELTTSTSSTPLCTRRSLPTSTTWEFSTAARRGFRAASF